MTVKLLTEDNLESLSFKGGCTGSSESTLVKITHCWKSHVLAHAILELFSDILLIVQKMDYLRVRNQKYSYAKRTLGDS